MNTFSNTTNHVTIAAPNVDTRQPILGVAVGKKGVGKTYETNKLIYRYITGQLSNDAHPRKALIIDVNDEFQHIKPIAIKDIMRFSASNIIEARRVRAWKEDGTPMGLDEVVDALSHVLKFYRGGLLLIEDINKYISDSLPQDLIGTLCTIRHMGVDVVCHFQGIGSITPKIWKNANWIRFHKNSESVEVHKSKFPDKERPLKILEAMVNIQYKGGNQRFFAYYDVDEDKIKGAYSQKMLWDAILQYLSENYNQTVKPLLNRVDIMSGKTQKKDPQEAVKELASKLYYDYYGN